MCFLGYSSSYKGYLCLDLHSSRIYVSRHVIFNEAVYPFASSVSSLPTKIREHHHYPFVSSPHLILPLSTPLPYSAPLSTPPLSPSFSPTVESFTAYHHANSSLSPPPSSSPEPNMLTTPSTPTQSP